MNTTAHHSSGYQHPTHPRRFSVRYPYTTTLIWLVVFTVSYLHLVTHWWPTDPYGMTGALIGTGGAIIRLIALAWSNLEDDWDE